MTIARKRGIYIISNEEYLTSYQDSLIHIYERSVVVNSLSKIYGFPGLRIGWLATKNQLLRNNALNYKRFVTVSNSSLCSALAVQVLQNRKIFEERYHRFCNDGMKIAQAMLKDMAELELLPLSGVPYVYLGLNLDVSSYDFAKRLLRDYKTLIMPAEVFEGKQAIRVSIGRHTDVLINGINHIKACIETYR